MGKSFKERWGLINKSQMAKDIGITRNHLYKMVNGHSNMTSRLARMIADNAYGIVSYDELMKIQKKLGTTRKGKNKG